MSLNDVIVTQETVITQDIAEPDVVNLDINQIAINEVTDVEYRTGWRTNYIDNPRMRQQVNYGADGYIYQPAGQYLYTLGTASPNVTGDIDIRVKVALDDYSKGSTQELLCKYGTSGNRSFIFRLRTDGTPELLWYPLGTSGLQKIATVNPNFTDGQAYWIRVTLDVDNGAGGNTVEFYQSDDGVSWTPIGAPVVTAGTTAIFASANAIETNGAATVNTAGKIYAAEIYDGIGGTLVYGWNVGTNWNATTDCITFVATTGQPVFLSYTGGENLPTNNYGYYVNGTSASLNLQRNSDTQYNGAGLLFTGGTATNHGVSFRTGSGFRIPSTPSQRVSAGIWVKVPTGSPQISLRIRRSQWTAVTGGTQNADNITSNTTVNDASGWVLLTGNFTNAATTNAIGFRIEYGATPAANAQFLISDFIIENLDTGTVGDYFDGSFTLVSPSLSPVTRWRGTTDASYSDLTNAADGTLTINQTDLSL